MFYAEPVVGYRSWRVNAETHDISSTVMQGLPWPADSAFVADCIDTQFRKQEEDCPLVHDAPHPKCSCGIHGFHKTGEVRKYMSNSRAITGSIVCWGRIQVGTWGFRAQYARPVAFSETKRSFGDRELDWSETLEGVVAKYAIPLVPFEDLVTYTETWGKPIGASYLDN